MADLHFTSLCLPNDLVAEELREIVLQSDAQELLKWTRGFSQIKEILGCEDSFKNDSARHGASRQVRSSTRWND